MRSLGHGYAGIEKFNTLTNIPKPMAVKNYNKTVFRIKKLLKLLLKRQWMMQPRKYMAVQHQKMILLTPVCQGMVHGNEKDFLVSMECLQ